MGISFYGQSNKTRKKQTIYFIILDTIYRNKVKTVLILNDFDKDNSTFTKVNILIIHFSSLFALIVQIP